MQKGVLPLPHQTFLKRITQLVSKRISRISRDQHIPEIAAKLKALQDLQTDMNAATANVKKEGVKHYEL